MYRKLTPLERCLLCGEDQPLLKSHVVPKFFRRWLAKELGQEPRFQNPHTRVGRYHDDLSKHSLCCADCEAVMSRDEAVARKQILEEWGRKDIRGAAYGPWLARFAAGMAAKAAGVLLHSPPTQKTATDLELPFNQISEEVNPGPECSQLADALETWRRFVLGDLSNPGRHELHLLSFDINAVPGLRGVFGHNYLRGDGCSGVLILVGGIAFFAVVRPSSELVRRATRIAVGQGVVGAHNYDVSPLLWDVLQRLSEANLQTQQVEQRVRSAKGLS